MRSETYDPNSTHEIQHLFLFTRTACARAGLGPSMSTPSPPAANVWCVSDVHADYSENMAWIKSLTRERFGNDVLILAGDVSASDEVLRTTLSSLVGSFATVFFTPGNHDLWVRGRGMSRTDEQKTSLDRLEEIFALCDELGVHTRPALAAGVVIAPIFSWYHASWDTEDDITGWEGIPEAEDAMVDFYACVWPAPLSVHNESVARHFDELNVQRVLEAEVAALRAANPSAPLISFSHFVPHPHLNPEKRFLFFPNLAKACGSDMLFARIERLAPALHVFGHTHFGWDATLRGVRYIQAPLSYPKERSGRLGTVATGETFPHGDPPTPVLIFDGAAQGFPPRYDAGWSKWYTVYPRMPQLSHILAPWVAGAYKRVPGVGETGWFGDAVDPATGLRLGTPQSAWELGPKSAVTFEEQQGKQRYE